MSNVQTVSRSPSNLAQNLKPSLKVDKTLKFDKSQDAHFVVVRTEDSSIFIGGEDKKLSKYDKNFKFTGSIDLKSDL